MKTFEKPYGKYSPKEEKQLQKHKLACYQRWRTKKLREARTWLSKTRGKEWGRRYDAIERKYGKRFAKDVIK
ncbi:MAG: hypothetical protein AB2793_09405 [Candidatus Thiodiazotropha sp.]